MTLEELLQQAAGMIAKSGLNAAQDDARVSSVPDARTIRYYATLGLLDRPKIVEREAQYNRRHLLQIVAIKALQTDSLPLARIQERLYGRTDAELEALIAASRRRPAELRPVRWQEIAVEPGLKILAQEGWSPRIDSAALEEKIRAAIAALEKGGKA